MMLLVDGGQRCLLTVLQGARSSALNTADRYDPGGRTVHPRKPMRGYNVPAVLTNPATALPGLF